MKEVLKTIKLLKNNKIIKKLLNLKKSDVNIIKVIFGCTE